MVSASTPIDRAQITSHPDLIELMEHCSSRLGGFGWAGGGGGGGDGGKAGRQRGSGEDRDNWASSPSGLQSMQFWLRLLIF